MNLNALLLFCSVVLIVCVLSSKLSGRLGLPTLLLFLVLGMLFGSDGILGVEFSDYALAEKICSAALVFIMFYGGFGTNWAPAKPVAFRAALLSTAGVAITAGLTGLFCRFALGMSLPEGLLLGSVVGSTDAASVFSILRGKRLGLRHGLASLLEVESGSNDPTAYTLTMILLTLMAGGSVSIPAFIARQVLIGAAAGAAAAFAARFLLRRLRLETGGLHTIFVAAAALLAYAVPGLLGGNGYLSVYICGIVLGNSRVRDKAALVHFFDGVTGIMQIVLFFLLGLLSFPSRMLRTAPAALAVMLFLTFVARPAAVFAVLTPFRVPLRQQLLVAWAGLRGAASIVFAIYTVISPAYTEFDIFHIVFCVALLSVSLQGTLLPAVARRLGLVGDAGEVLKTFSDYQDEASLQLVEMHIAGRHPWAGKSLREIDLPKDSLVVMIARGGEVLVPDGNTRISGGDRLVLSCTAYRDGTGMQLVEQDITRRHPWAGRRLDEARLPPGTLAVMVRRGDRALIPRGGTRLAAGDTVVLCSRRAAGEKNP